MIVKDPTEDESVNKHYGHAYLKYCDLEKSTLI